MKTCGSCVYWVAEVMDPPKPGLAVCFGGPPSLLVGARKPSVLAPTAPMEVGPINVRPILGAGDRACGAHEARPTNGEPGD